MASYVHCSRMALLCFSPIYQGGGGGGQVRTRRAVHRRASVLWAGTCPRPWGRDSAPMSLAVRVLVRCGRRALVA